MTRKTILFLYIAVIFQFVVLIGMYINAELPLWTGTEIKIKTTPIDPRSMFRGNYALLRYEISSIGSESLSDKKNLRHGEVIYVSLKPDKNDLYEFYAASLDKPESAIYLRGRIISKQKRFFRKSDVIEDKKYGVDYIVKYGIEAFFAPKEKALELEKKLQDGGVAHLMVSTSGKARLKDVIAE